MNTSNPTIVNVLNGKDVKIVPFWLMRQAGRYLEEYRAVRESCGNFLNLCYSP
ncbi:MAG: uroporphyrinogen decarboxylase, partial [Rhodospirillaceae bacterium]|nr:uroporphyrinogen decarboxylase [Rhodospirillaceae bacterium]